MIKKLYCYVDETGQDTKGDLFIVSVAVAEERDVLRQLCETIEGETGKGRVKWIKADRRRRTEYIRRIIDTHAFRGKLSFAAYHDTKDYVDSTVETIAKSIRRAAVGALKYKVTVLIDGLPRSKESTIRMQLNRHGIRIKKVRGVKKDENDALIRLADAICGFVRNALTRQTELRDLFQRGLSNGVLIDLTGK